MSAADFLENELTKWGFTAEVMSTRPSAWYVALHTASPSDSGSNSELFASWYVRKSVAWTRTNNTVSNTGTVTFDAVTGGSVTITHITIKDALSGGNTLAVLTLTTPVVCAIGDIYTVAIGAMTVTVD